MVFQYEDRDLARALDVGLPVFDMTCGPDFLRLWGGQAAFLSVQGMPGLAQREEQHLAPSGTS